MDLHPVSLTYYFKRKEDLAAACLLDTLARFDAMVAGAESEATPQGRLGAFVRSYFETRRRIVLDLEPPLAPFDEIRLIGGQHEAALMAAFQGLNRRIANLLSTPELPWLSTNRRLLLGWLIIEQVCWSNAWLSSYEPEDYARVAERIADLMVNGLNGAGQAQPDLPLTVLGAPIDPDGEVTRERFLVAATELINLQGYRGASVDKISACLNVTKGSFYHHNTDKDELAVACFERTFDLIDEAKRGALQAGNGWRRLWQACASLSVYQATGTRGRMLRHYALAAVPQDMRRAMLNRLLQITHSFAGQIADGIADGSIRPVDPLIAAHLLMATFNSASFWLITDPEVITRDTLRAHVRPALMGFFTPPAEGERAPSAATGSAPA
jgi:AcrR family transcriptional regulator